MEVEEPLVEKEYSVNYYYERTPSVGNWSEHSVNIRRAPLVGWACSEWGRGYASRALGVLD